MSLSGVLSSGTRISLANFEVLCHHSLHIAELGGAKQRQSKQTIDFFFCIYFESLLASESSSYSYNIFLF